MTAENSSTIELLDPKDVELIALHFTDPHEAYDKLDEIRAFIAEQQQKGDQCAVDVAYATGDFIDFFPAQARSADEQEPRTFDNIQQAIQSARTLPEFIRNQHEVQKFVEQHKTGENFYPETLDETAKAEFERLIQEMNIVFKGPVVDTIKQSYSQMNEALAGFNVPILGVLGNHDLTLGYDCLPNVTFLCNKTDAEAVTITGKSGQVFRYKGDQNTYEVPSTLGRLLSILQEYSIDYSAGGQLSEVEATVRYLENLRPKTDEEEHKRRKDLAGAKQYRDEITASYGKERTRLGDKDNFDVFLSHKLPWHKYGSSDVTKEYAKEAKHVCAGHEHALYIGNRDQKTIDAWLASEDQKDYVEIDGEKVPVLYLEEDEPMQINPGTNHFALTKYDRNKEVGEIVVYEFSK